MHGTSKNHSVKVGYEACRSVSENPPAAQYLRGRFISEATADQVGVRYLSGEADVWFHEYFSQGKIEVGDLITPVFDVEGEMQGVRGWPVPVYEGRDLTRLAMKGEGESRGLVMAAGLALAWLRGEATPGVFVIVEGEPDYLTCAQVWGGVEGVAVVGVVSGSWTKEFGAKIPDGARVILRVDADHAGEGYARAVYRTLGAGVEVWRYLDPAPCDGQHRDQNDLLRAGMLECGVDLLAYCVRYEPAPDPTPPPAPKPEEGSKREESYGDSEGWLLARAALYWAKTWRFVLEAAQGSGGTHGDPKGWSARGLLCLRAAHGLQDRAHRVTPAQLEAVEGSAFALASLDPKAMEDELIKAAMIGAGKDEATQKNRTARIEADAVKASRTALDMDGLTQKIDKEAPPKKEKKQKEAKQTKQPRPKRPEPDPYAEVLGEDDLAPIEADSANEDATPPAPSEPPPEGTPNTEDSADPLAGFPEELVVRAFGDWQRAQLRAAKVAIKGCWSVIDATHAQDMDLETWGRLCDQKPWHRIPSESEMAWRLLERCQPPGAPAPVADEATLWAYDPGSGLWGEVDQDRACFMMTGWDGAEVQPKEEDEGAEGGEWKPAETIRINERNSKSAYALALRYAKNEGFFDAAPHGFMTRSGFWLVDKTSKTITMMEKNPVWRARHLIDVDLTQPNTDAPMLVQYLSTVHAGHADAQQRVTLMGEAIFVALVGLGPFFKRAVMLQGKGGSGKSQLLDMIKTLIPKRARCVVPPQLMGEEYQCAKLAGMMLNLVTDIEAGEIIKEGSIKAIVHGEDVHGRNPYGRPFTVAPRALHMFSCNTWPAAPGVSEAFWDRWIAVRFEHRFRETESDIKDIGKYIAEHELNALVTWAVNCGIELLKRGKYTVPASTAAIMREWQNEGDSVAAWRAEATEAAQDMTEKGRRNWWPAAEAYQHYKDWCGKNGYKGIVNITNFGRRLKTNEVASHRFDWGVVYAIQEKRPADKPPDFL